MTEQPRSPLTDLAERTSRLSRWVAIIAIALGVGAVIVIIYGYWTRPGWAGVANKTFWDYLDLLIVPAGLAIGVWWLTREQSKRDREADDAQQRRDRKTEDDRRERERNAQKAQRERELAVENQRAQDEALQRYLDQMSQLLLDKDRPLRESQEGAEVQTLAGARTLTVLPRLDGIRKRSVLEFLYEANLIRQPIPVIKLGSPDYEFSTADLSGAELRGAFLRYAYLSGPQTGANLTGANLRSADLIGADLSRATLRGADLSGAILSDVSDRSRGQSNLSGADLSGVRGVTNEEVEQKTSLLQLATMPNGQKYEEWRKSKDRGEDGKNSGSS